MQTIYIVEDDEDIRESVLYALKSVGFDAAGFESGAAFFKALASKSGRPTLVLLDIMLPEEDGLSILRKLKNMSDAKSLPVIMLSAKSSEYDKVKGLNMGADDYVQKPFGVMELISRINAVLRRIGDCAASDGRLVCGAVVMDDARRVVHVNGVETALTFKEYELLHYFLINAGLALSRDKIMEKVWGVDFMGESRTLDMHIRTLRQKLAQAGEMIKTVRNVGYKFEGE